jgi:hypothetical protein
MVGNLLWVLYDTLEIIHQGDSVKKEGIFLHIPPELIKGRTQNTIRLEDMTAP